MSCDFKSIDQDIVNSCSRFEQFNPTRFFHSDSLYFMLSKNGKNDGLLAVKPYSARTCEIHLLIFKHARNKFLNSSITRGISNFLKNAGYVQVLVHTELKSVKKICQRMGMRCLFNNGRNIYLLKEFDNG